MGMISRNSLAALILLCGFLTTEGRAQENLTSTPNDQGMKRVKDDLGSGDEARGVALGVKQIKRWCVNNRATSINLMREWEPELMNTRHYQEAADVAMVGLLNRSEH